MATGVSCFTNAFANGLRFTYDLYGMGRALNAYSRLMDHWRQVLPLRQLEVDYQHLVSEPSDCVKEIGSFLEISVDAASTDVASSSVEGSTGDQSSNNYGISTASFWQARQPINTASVDSWKRFDSHLAPLRKGLSDGC